MSYKIPGYDMSIHILLILRLYIETTSEKIPDIEDYDKIIAHPSYREHNPVKMLLDSKIMFEKTRNAYLNPEILDAIKDVLDKNKIQINFKK